MCHRHLKANKSNTMQPHILNQVVLLKTFHSFQNGQSENAVTLLIMKINLNWAFKKCFSVSRLKQQLFVFYTRQSKSQFFWNINPYFIVTNHCNYMITEKRLILQTFETIINPSSQLNKSSCGNLVTSKHRKTPKPGVFDERR